MGSALNGAAAFHNKENSSELPGLPGLPRSPQNPPVSRLHGAGPSAMANMEGMAGLPPPGMGGKRGLQVAAGSTAKTMPCPVCGEEIATAAKKCRFCNEVFDRVGLKEIRQSSAPSTGEIPTALSVITFLSTLGSALIALASLGLCITGEGFMVGIGSFMLVLASLQFYAAVKTRNGSAQGRDIMVKLNLFSIILSVFSFQLLQIFFGFVCHKYLTRPDVVAYCCKD